jgi:hypothetical protein
VSSSTIRILRALAMSYNPLKPMEAENVAGQLLVRWV